MHSDIGRFTAKVISFEKIQSLPTGSAPNIKHSGVYFFGTKHADTLMTNPHDAEAHRLHTRYDATRQNPVSTTPEPPVTPAAGYSVPPHSPGTARTNHIGHTVTISTHQGGN